eukprot:7176972-Prorocentrum_lima.AAC.1
MHPKVLHRLKDNTISRAKEEDVEKRGQYILSCWRCCCSNAELLGLSSGERSNISKRRLDCGDP